jgi:hypothetical protein
MRIFCDIEDYINKYYPQVESSTPSDLEERLEEKRKDCEPNKHEYIETDDHNGQYLCRRCGQLKAPDPDNY